MKIFNRAVRIFTDGQDTGLKVDNLPFNHHVRVVDTNGTTAVNVFDENGAPCDFTVTAVVVAALDTTAGNITLKQAANTVAAVAKGTTAGVLTAEDSLANTSYSKGDACTVVSSSAGNATVFVYFKTA